MAPIRVLVLEFTDHAIEALDRRGIQPDHVLTLLTTRYIVKRNRKHRAASHVLIGYDWGGRCLAAPIVPTDDPVVWRVITVWRCKPDEAAMLR